MGNEHSGDVDADGHGDLLLDLHLHLACLSLPGAVVNEVHGPALMNGNDTRPKELSVCSTATLPFIREPIEEAR